MPELYPDDAALLALSHDEATGAEYIPTGTTPYYLPFRRLMYRVLRAAERANDLRVYQDGALSVGVRGGRCFIGQAAVEVAGVEGLAVAAGETSRVYVDIDGSINVTTAAFPSDRSTCLPLAEIQTGTDAIESIIDLRGESMYRAAAPATLGLTATAQEINQALDGIAPGVTAVALNFLTGGSQLAADGLHRHDTMTHDHPGEATLSVRNLSGDAHANAALRLHLPDAGADASLLLDRDTGTLRQRDAAGLFPLVGTVHVQATRPGPLESSVTGMFVGVAPVSGVVTRVELTLGTTLASDSPADGVTAIVKSRGQAVTASHPRLTAADGPGAASTAQGGGTASTPAAGQAARVMRGDPLTLDLLRDASGSVTAQASDAAVLVTILPDGPE